MRRQALGVKMVNPGGISAFKFNGRDSTSTRPTRITASRRAIWSGAHPRGPRTGRAASAARPLQQPGRARQHRHHARDHRGGRRPPTPPAHIQFHSYGAEGDRAVLLGRGAGWPRRERQPERHRRRRPGHVRPDRDRLGRRDGAVPQPRLRRAAQVGRSWTSNATRLRRRADQLSRQEFRQRPAMGDRPRDVPAGRGPLARLPDHRSSQRRAVHRLSASDPPADGPELPRRPAGRSSIRRRRRRHAGRRSTANTRLDEIAIITRAGAGADARPCRPRPSRRRRRRRHHRLCASMPIASACSPRRATSSRTAAWWCATASCSGRPGRHPCRARRSTTPRSSAGSRDTSSDIMTRRHRAISALGEGEIADAGIGRSSPMPAGERAGA